MAIDSKDSLPEHFDLGATLDDLERRLEEGTTHKRRRLRTKTAASEVAYFPDPVRPLRKTLRNVSSALGLTTVAFLQLQSWGIPIALFNIIGWQVNMHGPIEPSAHCFEEYCGAGWIGNAWEEHGLEALYMDKRRHDTFENSLTPEGFLTMLWNTRQVVEGGMHWFGVVCSTWVWCSRGTTKRSVGKPLGDQRLPCVREANMMACRMGLMILISIVLKHHWVVEQPQSSVIKHCPWVQFLHMLSTIFSSSTWLCEFGGDSRKALELLSHSRFSSYIIRRRDTSRDHLFSAADRVRHLQPHEDGRQRICGLPQLKETQEYTPEFGQAIFKAWDTGKDFTDGFPGLLEDFDEDDEVNWDAWRQAEILGPNWGYPNLDEVCEMVNIPADDFML